MLAPQARALVPTGLVLELPPGYEGQVRPRSGLALKQGLTVLNSPGTIDCDYRGEVMILLANLGGGQFEVRRGDRIAQLVVAPVITIRLEVVAELSKTRRGAGGFGSTVTKGTAAKRKSRKSVSPPNGHPSGNGDPKMRNLRKLISGDAVLSQPKICEKQSQPNRTP